MSLAWQGLLAGGLALAATGAAARAALQEPAQEGGAPAEPFIEAPLKEAQGLGRMLGKQVLLAFYEQDCAACDELDREALGDERVLAWLDERVLGLRLRPGSDFLRTRWRIEQCPTLVFVTWQDEELGRLTDPLPPQAFLEAAGAILDGTSGLERARERVARAPEDPWARLLLARALKARDRLDEYLAELLAVLDATRGVPDWRRLREGEVLREVGLLAYGSSAAREALIERRNASLDVLLAPQAQDQAAPVEAELLLAARDVRLLNIQLGAAQQTLATWETVREREDRPAAVAAELFGWEVAGLLMRTRRYAELLAALPDPLVVVQERMAELQAIEAAARESSADGTDPQVERNRMLTEAGSLYEALLGAGQEQDAGDLAELLVAFAPQARAWSVLVLGAKRAGRADLARAHLERGLESLADPDERERLQRFGESALRR